MVKCHDENADHNAEIHRAHKAEQPTKPSGASISKPLETQNPRVPQGLQTGDTSALKFGPSFQEWKVSRQQVRQEAAAAKAAKESSLQFPPPASPRPAAGRHGGPPNTSRRHLEEPSHDGRPTLARRHLEEPSHDGPPRTSRRHLEEPSHGGPPRTSRRHFSSKDALVHMGSEDAEQPGSVKREEVLGSGPTMVFSSSILSDVDAAWSHSLRAVVPPQPWTPRITIPQGPTFHTPNRSRSASVRSCTPDCATPEVCDTPRGRTLPWEQSLRGRAPRAGSVGRAVSVDHTPRNKRRSLSHWWAESSAPPKVGCPSDLNTTQKSTPMTPDADDAISDSSVVEPLPHTDPVILLNSMPHHSKRLSVERKRHRLAEMSREQAPSENGNQNWSRSLRQGRSCPPPSTHSMRTRGREPNMHTGHRAQSRATSRSSERFVMGESHNLHPRERSAVDKYLERARSRSTEHSTSATPERQASLSRRRFQPREQAALARHLERVGSRGRSTERSGSATPERSTSSGCWPFNARERAALQTHLERVAARSCSAQPSASATPERQTAAAERQTAAGGQVLPAHERSAVVKHFKSQLENHLEKHLEKHLERVAEAAAAGAAVAEAAGGAAMTESHPVPKNQSAERTFPVAQSAAKSAPAMASKVMVEKSKMNVDKEWVRKATNPEERAERARTATQTKLEQALVHQRNRVCIFKRRVAAAPQ